MRQHLRRFLVLLTSFIEILICLTLIFDSHIMNVFASENEELKNEIILNENSDTANLISDSDENSHENSEDGKLTIENNESEDARAETIASANETNEKELDYYSA